MMVDSSTIQFLLTQQHDPTLPDGWRQIRLDSVATIRFSSVDKKSRQGERHVFLCNYMDVYNKEYVYGHENFMCATASESDISCFSVNPGDVIITKDSETPDDIGVPAVIGKNGVEKIIELELNDEERQVFDTGIQSVKSAISGIQI